MTRVLRYFHQDPTKTTSLSSTSTTTTIVNLDSKQDKIKGKSLSTNDFTDIYKQKLKDIEDKAEVNVQADWNTTDTEDDSYIKNKPSSLPASDVYDWAKQETKPSYNLDEVLDGSLRKLSDYIPVSLKGIYGGVATLGANDGKVPESQLPSYVDDVLEFSDSSYFPQTGESGKIYVDIQTNLTYRWTGTQYTEISPSIALGETSSTAYAGDKGKALKDAYEAHASDTTIHITAAERAVWNAKQDAISDLETIRSNASTAYGWGDHSLAGYLTSVDIADMATKTWVGLQGYTTNTGTVTSVAMTVPTGLSVSGSPITTNGTLAITFASGYSIPTTTKLSNWDTAYGWGDHSLAGYQMAISDLATIRSRSDEGHTAYGWGDHSQQGYVKSSGVTSVAVTVPTGLSISGSPITSTGTLALSFANGYSIPTDAKQSNWDTAYSWGNHANEGYLKSITSQMVTNALGYTPPTQDTNTWRPITDTYTGSDTGTSVSLKGTNDLYNALVNGYASSAGNADTVDGYHLLWTDKWGPSDAFTFPNSGLRIQQTNDESSGISFNGDYINMWSPADGGYSIRYWDEDNGNELWYISDAGYFSGSSSYSISSGNADTVDGYHAYHFFRYEGWWNSEESHNTNDAEGMTFVYQHHGSPHGWGILSTFSCAREYGYKTQLFSDGYTDGYTYYRNKSSDRGGWGDWIRFLDSSNWTSIIDGRYLPFTGGTLTGTLNLAGTDLHLGTSNSSSDDSGDIVFYYGNGAEKSRIWVSNTYTNGIGPWYRVYDSDGTLLYNGRLATAGDLENYLPLSGGTLTGDVIFSGDTKIEWNRNTDGAGIRFKNTDNGDSNSYMSFYTLDDYNEYFRFSHLGYNGDELEWFTIKPDGARVLGNTVWHAGNDGSGSGLDADLLDGYHASTIHTAGWNDVEGLYYDNGNYYYHWYKFLISDDSCSTYEIKLTSDYNYPRSAVYTLVITRYYDYSVSYVLLNNGKDGGDESPKLYITNDSSGNVYVQPIIRWGSHMAVRCIHGNNHFIPTSIGYASDKVATGFTPATSIYTDSCAIRWSFENNALSQEFSPTIVTNITGNSSYAPSAGNSDTVDNLHASDFVRFFLSPMAAGAPADSAESWFVNTMPSASGAIVYNVTGSEKTIIAGKSSGSYGHMLQLNYDDTYLRILRYYGGTWQSSDWEKISAGYADYAASLQTTRYIWGQPFNGTADIYGAIYGAHSIEFTGVGSSEGHGGYIDFHYNGSSADYTSRIIEDLQGRISVNNSRFYNNAIVTLRVLTGLFGPTVVDSPNDAWSDGTWSHPWYSYDVSHDLTSTQTSDIYSYLNEVSYHTTISDYFGIALRTNLGRIRLRFDGTFFIENSQYTNKIEFYNNNVESVLAFIDRTGGTYFGFRYGNGATTSGDYLSVGDQDRNTYLRGRDVYIYPDTGGIVGFFSGNEGYNGVGTSSPSYKLQVDGACAASSFPNTSDLRLKRVYADWYPTIELIAEAPIFTFKWKDNTFDDDIHIGSSALYWQDVAPELVTTAKDDIGTLSLQYDVLGLASSVTVAKEVIKLQRELEDTKEELELLRAQIAELKLLLK